LLRDISLKNEHVGFSGLYGITASIFLTFVYFQSPSCRRAVTQLELGYSCAAARRLLASSWAAAR